MDASPQMPALSRVLHPHKSLCSQAWTRLPCTQSVQMCLPSPSFQVLGCLVESWATTALKILETKAVACAVWVCLSRIMPEETGTLRSNILDSTGFTLSPTSVCAMGSSDLAPWYLSSFLCLGYFVLCGAGLASAQSQNTADVSY